MGNLSGFWGYFANRDFPSSVVLGGIVNVTAKNGNIDRDYSV